MKYPDISHHHPVEDWTSVKKNVAFLISKATQGTTYTDSTLDSFIKNCESKKIPYWLYAFLEKGDGKAQAKYLVDKCKTKVGKYFVGYIVDAEINPTKRTKPTDTQVRAALDYLSSLKIKWGLYTGYADYSYYKNSITKAKNSTNGFWWEARYGNNNGAYNSKYPCNKGVSLHQFTSLGACPGISGKIDLNRLTGVKKESWFTEPLKASADPAPEDMSHSKKPTLRYGDTGKDVRAAQTLLKKRGFYGGSIDGIFKQKTLDGTRDFQQSRNLKIDGIIGIKTWTELEKENSVSVKVYSLKKDGDKSISDNFKIREFRCKDDSDKILIDVDFAKKFLQKIRDHFGAPVTINSAYRTATYNKKIGGATNSYHVKGQAFDIVVKGHTPLEVAKYAQKLGIKGISQYNTFVHIDSRSKKYWARNNNGKVTVKSSF